MRLIHIAFSKVYKVGHVTFEWHHYLGPTIISKRTGEAVDMCHVGNRSWAMISRFQSMTEQDRENHRVY